MNEIPEYDRCYCSSNSECAYCLREIELAELEEDDCGK